jgi:O-antigen ligase
LFLEITYYLGLVGLILMSVYYISLIYAIDVNLKKQNLIARYVVLLVVLMFHMTLHGMITFHTYAAFFVAAVAMLVLPKEVEETPYE